MLCPAVMVPPGVEMLTLPLESLWALLASLYTPMPITPAMMTLSRNRTPTTIRTIFRTVLPEVVGGGGMFGYGGLGGMGAPVLIVRPRALFSCSLKRGGYSMAAMMSIEK